MNADSSVITEIARNGLPEEVLISECWDCKRYMSIKLNKPTSVICLNLDCKRIDDAMGRYREAHPVVDSRPKKAPHKRNGHNISAIDYQSPNKLVCKRCFREGNSLEDFEGKCST